MSNNPTVSEWFQTEYVTGVEHAFQHKGHTFGKFCRRRTLSGATEAEFHFFGILTASEKGPGKIPRQKGNHSKIKLGTKKYYTGVEIEQYDLDQMQEDDRDAAKEAAGLALARKADEVFLDAIALTVEAPLGGAGEFMSPGMSQAINRRFIAQNVMPGNPVVVVVSEMMWSQLMRFDQFVKSNYTGPALPWAAETGMQARTWDSKHWVVYNNLPITGDVRTAYAWTPKAIAEVQLKEIFVQWSWENTEDLWFGNHNFAQGNKILMPKGIVPIEIDESILPEMIDPETYEVAV